ncbi:MAG: transport system permease protein, partial [Arthrobacter sp.]|nr:transport system permease protein [Arthrobacter sp.]
MPSTLQRPTPLPASGNALAAVLSARRLPPSAVLILLAAAALAAAAIFLFIDLKGNVGYVLSRRSVKLGTMVVVATAVGVSTLLFQTVTSNRILTPSIMGFDSLYLL